MDRDSEILRHIQAVRGSMNRSLQRIADFVLAEPEAAKNMNIRRLALACDVSESTISRFVRTIGMENYRGFLIQIAEELSKTDGGGAQAAANSSVYENIQEGDDAESVMQKIVHRHMDILRSCPSTLSLDTLDKAARALARSRIVYFFAAGSSCLAAENGVLRFGRIGRAAIFHRDHNTQMFFASGMPDDSVAVAISDSGRTTQTVDALATAKSHGNTTVAVTSYPNSPLTKHADFVLVTPSTYEPSGRELLYESMVSKVSQMLAIDVLYSLTAVYDHDTAVRYLKRSDPYIKTSRSRG